MNLSLYIARRYLLGKKSRNAINIISGISVMGIVVGSMALVIVLSVFNGFDSVVKTLISTTDPDLQIAPATGKTFRPEAAQLDLIRQLDEVEKLSEVLEENVLLLYRDRQHIATLKGVDEHYKDVTGIDTMIIDGEMKLRDNERPHAVVGQGIAISLGMGLHFINPLYIYTIDRQARINMSNPEGAIRRDFIYPSGIFAIEADFDSRYLLVPLDYARELLDYQNEVSFLEIGLSREADVASVQDRIREILGEECVIRNREQQNALFYQVMRSEKWAIFLILSFILFIASFNIIGSLSMLIIDKKKDILTLKNLGADHRLIKRIFLIEGWLISFAGSFIGISLGTLISWVQQQYGLIKLSASGSFIIDAYPVRIELPDILAIWVTVLMIGLFLAFLPVRQISRQYLDREAGALIV